jgi:ferredoxin-NADP reductase
MHYSNPETNLKSAKKLKSIEIFSVSMTKQVTMKKIFKLNPVAKSITLKRPDGFDFIAGQHVIFYIDKKGGKPFTMTSSPTDKRRLEFGIKRVGEFTKKLHELKPGDKVEILGPLGTFYFEDKTKDDLVFIAGGSGITPFISMLRYIEEKKLRNRVTVIYSNKKSKEAMYFGELELLRDKGIINEIVYTVTGKDPDWSGLRGRVSREMLESVHAPEKKVFFICGPPEFEEAVSKILRKIHIRRKRVKIAAWG